MSKVTYDTDKGGYQTQVIIKSVLIYIVLILLTLMCLVPIWILVVNATRLHDDIIAASINALVSALNRFNKISHFVK